MLPLLPVLAWVATLGPRPRVALGAAAAVSLFPALVVRPPEAPSIEAARAARNYASLRRENPLIVVTAEDSFHASTLGLSRLHYALAGTGQPPEGYALNFRAMGIVVSVAEFLELERQVERFRPVLREWGLDRDDAIASVIALGDEDGLARLVAGKPECDFLMPARVAAALEGVEAAGGGRRTAGFSCLPVDRTAVLFSCPCNDASFSPRPPRP